MKKIICIILFLLIALVTTLTICRENFKKIENKIIDKDLNVISLYNNEDDIKNLYNNNKQVFNEIVVELEKTPEIEKCREISIPFDYPQNELIFYGENKIDYQVNDGLRNNLVFLSNELKINKIYIRKVESFELETSNGEKECSYIFFQFYDFGFKYNALMASPIDLRHSLKKEISSKFSNFFGDSILINNKINDNNNINWYYRYSCNKKYARYNFGDKLYDIVHNNI